MLYFLVASPVAQDVAQAPQLSGPLALGAALIVLSGISIVQVGALVGFEAFRVAASLTAIEGMLTAIGMTAGALVAGVLGAVGGMVAALALSCVWRGRVLSKACAASGISIRHRGVAGEGHVLWSFVLPSWLYGVSTQPFEWLSRLLLARGPGGLADVGIFSAAYAWSQALLATGRAWPQAAVGLIWGTALLAPFMLSDSGAVALARSHVAAAILAVMLQVVLIARTRHHSPRPRPDAISGAI
ncbi:MAG TPA: hypothetical protein VES67_13120 [Vicinamibacterales bacterium]|nr:hypothetical protein [Vicinamibacterales bacterium]